MITDTEVLARLSKILTPGEIPAAVSRLIRAPLTWEDLHRPAVLAATNLVSPGHLNPSQLALASINLSADDLNAGSLSAESGKNDWSEILTEQKCPETVEQAASYALHIIKASEHMGWEDEAARVVLSNPAAWREPLLIAWPHLGDDHNLFHIMTTSGRQEALPMLCDSLLANESLEQAAESIFRLSNGELISVLTRLHNRGEDQLVSAVLDFVDSETGSPGSGRTIPRRLAEISVNHTANETLSLKWSDSPDTLETGFKNLSSILANAADAMADDAREQQDIEIEIDRRKQALLAEPTPLRRALLAQALNYNKKYEDSLDVLADAYESIEECIAAGTARLGLNDRSQAAVLFEQAANNLDTILGSLPYWCCSLIDSLREMGDHRTSLLAAMNFVKSAPGIPEAHQVLAEELLSSGDHLSASEKAQLGLSLFPNIVNIRKTLAFALQSSGKHREALPHWEKISEDVQEQRIQLADCALKAGSYDTARSTVNELLQEDPDNLTAKALHAQALALSGEPGLASEYLHELLASHPDEPKLWNALFQIMKRHDIDEEIEATLLRANQAAVDSAELLTEFACWLRDKGRTSEALGYAERAFRIDQKNADTAIIYSEILKETADPKAEIVLQKAHELQPRNWSVMLDLAEIWESQDSVSQAAKLLTNAPIYLDAEQSLTAGRILYRASENDEMLAQAVKHLKNASNNNNSPGAAAFWLAESLADSGQLQEALQAYQSYLTSSEGSSFEMFRKRAYLNLARAASAADDTILSLTTLEDAREFYPEDPDVLLPLSKAYRSAGLFQQSMDTAMEVLLRNEHHEEAMSLLLNASIESGDYSKSREFLQKMMKSHPTSPQTWLNAAALYLAQNLIPEMRSAIGTALLHGRQNADILIHTSRLLIDAGMKESAARVLRYGINHLSVETGLLRQLAETSEETSDYQTAQKAWRRYTQQAPDDPQGYLRAIKSLWALSRNAAAIELLGNAVDRFPGESEFPVLMGELQLAEGNPVSARQSFHEALNIDPEDPSILKRVSRGLITIGELMEARKLLKSSLDLYPASAEIRSMLAETLLLQNEPQQAYELLKDIDPENIRDASSHAIAALAAVKSKKYKLAQDHFAQAHARILENERDVLWFSRSARSLGFWDLGLQAFSSLQQTRQEYSASLQQELIFALIEAREADSILRELCSIRAHAVEEHILEEATLLALSDEGKQSSDGMDLNELRLRLADRDLNRDLMKTISSLSVEQLTPPMLTSLAVTQLLSSQPSQALDTLRQVHQSGALDDWQNILIVIALIEQDQTDLARKTISRLHINPSFKPLLQYLEGKSYKKENRKAYCQAISHALTEWADEPVWHYQLGLMYSQLSEISSAIPHLQQAVLINSEDVDAVHLLAKMLQQDGQLMESAEAYEHALRNNPNNSSIYVEAGLLALELEQPEKASRWFDKAGEMGSRTEDYFIGSAKTASALQQYQKAEDFVSAILQKHPENSQAMILLGEIYRKAGQPDKALQTLDKASLLLPDSQSLSMERARLMIETGYAEDALKLLQNLVEQEPDDETLWAVLSEAHQAAGNADIALEAINNAVRLAPRNHLYRTRLAALCSELGQLDRALDELDNALELSPENMQAYALRGQIYEARKQYNLALDSYQKAITLDPDQPQPHYQAGMILKKMKAYPEAGLMLKQAASLNPHDPDILHQLAAVRALELVHGQILQPVVES